MKRRIVCTVSLFFVLLSLAVLAASGAIAAEPAGDFTVSAKAKDVRPGGVAEYQLSISGNTEGLSALNLSFEYNEEYFVPLEIVYNEEYLAGAGCQPMPEGLPNGLITNFASMNNIVGDGVFATVRFGVRDTAPFGSYPITMTCNEAIRSTEIADQFISLTPVIEDCSVGVKPAVTAANVYISTDYSILFYVDPAYIDGTDYTVTLSSATATKTYKTGETSGFDGEDYMFFFESVAPDKFGDTVTAKFSYTKEGETYDSLVFEYSMKQYCYNILNRYATYEANGVLTDKQKAFRTVVVDMLNYGAAAQVRTGHNSDKLVNAELTEAEKLYASPAPELNSILRVDEVNTDHAVFRAANVFLDNTVNAVFYVAANDISKLEATVQVGDGAVQTVSSFYGPDSDGDYYFFTVINFLSLDKPITVKLYHESVAEENLLSTMYYDVATYASRQESSSNMGRLACEMMKLGRSVVAYSKY